VNRRHDRVRPRVLSPGEGIEQQRNVIEAPLITYAVEKPTRRRSSAGCSTTRLLEPISALNHSTVACCSDPMTPLISARRTGRLAERSTPARRAVAVNGPRLQLLA